MTALRTRSPHARLSLGLVVGSALLTGATAAFAAGTPEQIAAARALGRAGIAEMEAGDCEAAVNKLSRAESLYHAPTTAEPLGECQIRLGKIVEGTETLNKLLREPLLADAPAAFVAAQEKARDELARASPRIAKLRVHVTTSGGAGEPRVTIDDAALNAALLDNDRPTDPGTHVVKASAPGCLAIEKTITLGDGETQTLSLSLAAASGAPPTVAAAPADPIATVAPTVDTAAAGPDPRPVAKGVRTHDGFYFRAALGAALFAGGSITPPGSSVDASVSGAGPSLELSFGGTVWNGLVIGGGIFGMSAPSPSYSANGASLSGGAAVVSSIGPFADWYVDPKDGWHVQASIGLAAIQAAKGTPTNIGGTSYTFPGADEGGTGVSLLAGVGYEWWIGEQVSFGALARLQYVNGSVEASGDTQSTHVSLVLPALLGTLTYQ